MTDSTRRGFLYAAGAGAVAVGAAAVLPATASAAVPAGPAAALGPVGHEPVVAYVSDARSGQLSLMVGEREVVVRDPDLVARLVRAAS